jgi:hypothetical protein
MKIINNNGKIFNNNKPVTFWYGFFVFQNIPSVAVAPQEAASLSCQNFLYLKDNLREHGIKKDNFQF